MVVSLNVSLWGERLSTSDAVLASSPLCRFNIVIHCTGRVPQTQTLGLENTRVQLDEAGYLVGKHSGDFERTSVPHIYAIGDVLKVCFCVWFV